MRFAFLGAVAIAAVAATPAVASDRAGGADRVAVASAAKSASNATSLRAAGVRSTRVADTSAVKTTKTAKTASTQLARAQVANGRAARAPRARAGESQPAVSSALATAAIYNPIDSTILNSVGTEIFGAVLVGEGAFNDVFSFTLDADYITNAQLSTIDLSGIGVDFSSVLLDGYAFTQSSIYPETWLLDPAITLLAGVHNIYVNGTIGSAGSGSYSGNINLAAAPGAVPEPGTWMMMLLGFGAAGYTMRRRRPRQVLAQIA